MRRSRDYGDQLRLGLLQPFWRWHFQLGLGESAGDSAFGQPALE
jgi:hypothetical protein